MQLHPHPSSSAQFTLAADLKRTQTTLDLTYTLTGNLAAIIIPPPSPPIRTDELWRTTCFELFAILDGEAYAEYNFSPSGAWAAYRFDRYREGMSALAVEQDPAITLETAPDRLTLNVALATDLPENTPIALAAIVETRDSTKHHFALAHSPGAPDFHHRSCFAATLPPMSGE